ncbi:unnamed protein product, partial [Rotaria sp. Silwood2]
MDEINELLGRILHSQEFHGANQFSDLSLLIIGGGVSSNDIQYNV